MKDSKRKNIIFICLVIAVFIGVKYYCFLKYDESPSIDVTEIKISGNVTINHIDLKDDEYYPFEDIKVKNVFEGYEKNRVEDNTFITMAKKDNDRISQAIVFGSEEQYIDILKNNSEYKGVFNKIAEKENINDDIDLLKYMEKHNDDEVKFFMTVRRQKQIYTLNEFKANMLPSIEYIKTVDGYYSGYMYKSSAQTTEYVFIKNNKRYFFSFLGDYSEEFINDFMSCVLIEG